ncbi:serine/threonine-protein kinase 11-interacting protein [Pelodytes ibericus]
MQTEAPGSLVQALSQLLRDHGELVLDGSRVLSLLTPCLQVITRLFEQLFPRGPGSGFQALPSHPADSVPILQTQFLLDVFQKTPSLKLIHPPECPRQFDVTIFPFKSLRCLEIRCLPSHCLRGLRSVYSQLEVLTCYKSVTSLEEVISLCGGDLSSALPWLELHTLNFSFNTIRKLDHSLELLNSLKILDLSHNQIQDCGSFLKIPTELQYLNLGFNLLTKVPEISLEATAKLHSLILRHNQLSSTSGLEHLRSLQHLDLSFNLLYDHSQLSGLTPLHRLRKLFLEGNPLYFHKDHQTLTARYLCPQTLDKMFLDGYLMSKIEMAKAEEEAEQQQEELRSQQRKQRKLQQKQMTLMLASESSCTGDLTDSYSATDQGAQLPPKKSKVKVRRASISEPSDSDADQRKHQNKAILTHQEDIERTDHFRKLYGADWLQYRDHLESELSQGDPKSSGLPPVRSPSPPKDLLAPYKLKDHDNWKMPSSDAQVTEDTKAPVATEDTEVEKEEDLEDDIWGKPGSRTDEEEEFVIVDPLCPPVTVCPILDEQSRYDDWPWVFLRITPQYLVEIELERGKVSFKRDLYYLKTIQTAVTPWEFKGEVKDYPVLTLIFDTNYKDDKRRQYLVLDNSPDLSIKTLTDVLHPILDQNLKAREALVVEKEPERYRCLKCQTVFVRQEGRDEVYSKWRWRRPSIVERQDTAEGDLRCPICGSIYVCLSPLPVKKNSLTSVPTENSQGKAEKKGSNQSAEDTDSQSTGSSSPSGRDDAEGKVSHSLELDQQPHPGSNGGSLSGSLKSGAQTPLQSNNSQDPRHFIRYPDQQLQWHLHMEYLHGEEYRCCVKVPVVRFGNPTEYCAVVLVSDKKIYVLKVTGEIRGEPSDWLKPGDIHDLTTLRQLHVGLNRQTVHLGFDEPDAAFTLLIKNPSHSQIFCTEILNTFSTLLPQHLENLVHTPEESLAPQHPIWPLLHDKPGAEDASPPEFLYLLVSFLREDVVNQKDGECNGLSPASDDSSRRSSVSLLCTRKHMFILEETHQWFHKPPTDGLSGPPDPVTVKEKQPIVNISSVNLFRSEPGHLHIRTYNEVQRRESAWLIWTEDVKVPGEIVAWLKDPWEAEYRIGFNHIINNES